jgi:hypothetical protein
MKIKSREKRPSGRSDDADDSSPWSIANLLTVSCIAFGFYIAGFGVGIFTLIGPGPVYGHLSPHPWAIPIGAAIVVLALWLHSRGR